MPYCLYLRKSRADAEAETRGEGETLARHEHALTELGKRLNLNITQIYREIVSGETIAARPVMQQLLSDVEQGVWSGVLVMEVERLARGDTIDQGIVAQTFKFSGTKIITPAKTYDPNNEYDEEYFEFGLFMSRREYKAINRRLQRGRLASVKEGKYVGNRPPYGYLREKLEHEKGFTLIPSPDQASAVQMIFDLYAHTELGVSKIVRRLNDLKVPPGRGDAWVNASVQEMLRNPVYIGKIRWNARPLQRSMREGKIVKERPRARETDWILVDGLHQPLIDPETWSAVQTRLGQNEPHPAPKNHVIMNPLSGLVVCGVCGRRMVRRPYGNKNPDTLMCPAASCCNISSQLDYVEARVLKSLREWLDKYRIEVADRGKKESSESAQKSLNLAKGELSNLKKQQEKLYGLLEKGIYTAEVFLERSESLGRKRDELLAFIDSLSAEIKQVQQAEQGWSSIIPNAESVLQRYPDAASAEEKNALLKSVIEKAVYTKKVNGRWHGCPDDFELVLYPRIPK